MLSPRWQHEPLSGEGAARQGGRWNARGMPALYFSADHATAIAEYMQGLIHPGTLTRYDIRIDGILDLTDVAEATVLGVDDRFLKLPWRTVRDLKGREPETWAFARDAVVAGIMGMWVASVQGRGVNLVLWQWANTPGSVRVVDPLSELQG